MDKRSKNNHKSDAENQREFYLNLNIGRSVQENKARLAAQGLAKESLEKAKQLLENEHQQNC